MKPLMLIDKRIQLIGRLTAIFFVASLVFVSSSSLAIEFLRKSRDHVEGYSGELGIDFRGKLTKRGMIRIDLELDDKKVVVHVGTQKKKTIKISSYVISSGEVVTLTPEDSDRIKDLLSSMLQNDIGRHRIGKMLLRTLNLLYSWPTGLPVMLNGHNSEQLHRMDSFEDSSEDTLNTTREFNLESITGWTECDWPFPMGLSASLCNEMNELHEGKFIVYGSYIGDWWDIPLFPMYYPWLCWSFEETVGPFPFEEGSCFGRCGKGCIGAGVPDNDLNIFTQNCFNHDGCVGALGLIHPYCNQMFFYSIIDYYFGSNCFLAGLVAYYPFSGNADDESGNGHDGTVDGPTLTIDREENPDSAYYFDGVDDEIVTGGIDGFEEVTVSAWIYPYELKGDWNRGMGIVSMQPSSGNGNWKLTTLDEGRIYWEYNYLGAVGPDLLKTAERLLAIENWAHVVAVRTQNAASIYFNGELAAHTDHSQALYTERYPVIIGNDHFDNLPRRKFHGIIDEVRIYNRALSETEVQVLYNSP
jgi:hypothetical protein